MPAQLIILEGNISAGKTSLARDLEKLLDYKIFLEPTVTNPYLEKFYADPPKYALVMQIWLLKQRFRIYIAAIKYALESGKGVILDRSVFSDWVFAEKNRLDKNITEEGYQEYLDMRNTLLAHLPIPQITVYLDVSPSECHRRVHHLRGRDCEAGIPLGYLAGLDECYRKFLAMMEASGSRVIAVPWNTFGNSNSVAQQIKAQASTARPLEEMVDVAQLTDYVYQHPFVLKILAETIEQKTEKSEQEYSEEESQRTVVTSTPPTTPTKPIKTTPNPASPRTPPAKATGTPQIGSPAKLSPPKTNFSPSKSPIPTSPPLMAN